MGEIEAITDNVELFQSLGEMLDESSQDPDGKKIRDRQNEVYKKVISMSGRIDDVTAAELTRLGITHRLDKPFSPQQLADVLREIFDRTA